MNPLRLAFIVVAALFMLATGSVASAHATSTTYLVANATADTSVHLTYDIPVTDVHWALDLDANGDGAITWSEIEARRLDIATLVASHLFVSRGDEVCPVRFDGDLQLAIHTELDHLSLGFSTKCEKPGLFALTADLFFDADPTQRTLIDITTVHGQFTSILSPSAPTWSEPSSPSWTATFATFVGQGLWHVWIGYDHLAFLILLLLPGVLRSTGKDWRGTEGLKDTARDLLRIITAFTIAHSITLALAASGAVHVPVRPIEIAIAGSIVIAGLLNLIPQAAKARLALAFGFGLVHGFGFANALAELGTGGLRLLPTLAGFNTGVELAQLSLVAIVLPVLFRARHSKFYAWRFMPATSIVAAMAGAAWLVARAG
jgi:HupE/UreJ protein